MSAELWPRTGAGFEAEYMSQPRVERGGWARKSAENGYVETDEEQRTSAPFAAGDVTRLFAHQVVTASHEGATAGITANYDLYEEWQKHDPPPPTPLPLSPPTPHLRGRGAT